MLRFLTDEHVSPNVARAAQKLCPQLGITAIREWRQGHMLGASDDLVLQEACRERLTLVTFDLRTIPPLLRVWAEQGIAHGGVVLVDERTIVQADVGRFAAALCSLWKSQRRRPWTNRIVFLHGVSA